MALFDKTDFEGTHTIDTAAKVEWCLQKSNNKGNQHFNSMAPYGDTNTTPPLSKAEMIQSYTLDAAAVEVVLQNHGSGLRGHRFLTAVKLLSIVPAPTIDVAGPAAQAVFSLAGVWTDPTVLNVAITVTGGDDISTAIAFATDLLSPEDACATVAAVLNTLSAGVNCVATGATVTVSAVTPATLVEITTLAIAV